MYCTPRANQVGGIKERKRENGWYGITVENCLYVSRAYTYIFTDLDPVRNSHAFKSARIFVDSSTPDHRVPHTVRT